MQENNIISTPETTTLVAVEQRKQSIFLIILLSVLLIVSISIAAFFAYQTQKLVKELTTLKEQEKVAIDTSKFVVEPVATENSNIYSTTSWKVYKNSENNFLFKYDPSKYEPVKTNEQKLATENNAGEPSMVDIFKSYKNYLPPKFIGAIKLMPKDKVEANSHFSVWIFDNSNNISISEWYEKYNYYPYIFGGLTREDALAESPKNETVVGTMKAYWGIPSGMYLVKQTYIQYKSRVYLISSDMDNSEHNQILSTFEFFN